MDLIGRRQSLGWRPMGGLVAQPSRLKRFGYASINTPSAAGLHPRLRQVARLHPWPLCFLLACGFLGCPWPFWGGCLRAIAFPFVLGPQQILLAAVPGAGFSSCPYGPYGKGRALGFGLTPLPSAWAATWGRLRGGKTLLPGCCRLCSGWEGRPGGRAVVTPCGDAWIVEGGGGLSLRGSARPWPFDPPHLRVGGEAPPYISCHGGAAGGVGPTRFVRPPR